MSNAIDILNRQPFLNDLIRIVHTLAENRRGCAFAIDGQWGCGKTFILDRFEEQISLFQDAESAGDRYLLFRYNCWQYDYYDEPSMAIVAAIRDEVEKCKRLLPEVPIQAKAAFEVAKDLGKKLLGNVIETKFGINPFEYVDKIQDKSKEIEKANKKSHSYDSYFAFNQALDDTRKQLSKMAEDKPIIILVDELDRCIPEYAIKVLERLHHLFDGIDNIIVILAIDGTQLKCAVQNIYGIDDFSVEKYLKKFVSFTLKLNTGKLDVTFWDRHREYLDMFHVPSSEDDELINELIPRFFEGIDVRTQEKIMERILMLHRLAIHVTCDLSILYFELMHQILPYVFNSDGFKLALADVTDTFFDSFNSNPIYDYIKQLSEKATCGTVVYNAINAKPKKLLEHNSTPLGAAFWYFAALQYPINGKVCGNYRFEDAKKYEPMIKVIKMFDELSRIIK